MAIVITNPFLFAILGQSNFEQIAASLQEKYRDEYYSLASGQWLLSAPGKTTKEVAESLGISAEPSIAAAMIVAFSNYYGRANPQIWEWIAAKMGAKNG